MAFVRIPNTHIFLNTDNITSFRQWWDEDKKEHYTSINFIHQYDNINVYSSAASFETIIEKIANVNESEWSKRQRRAL